MKFKDRVYGEVEISEPVLLEIINSSTFQRLKDIDQYGYSMPFFQEHHQLSRFEHSVGVCLLLKKYSAPIEEQIAGLIHDVSHSAFSHVIDYVLDAGSQKTHDHQDNIFEDFVKKSEIPAILSKYNFDLNYILDDDNFPLKENNLPDLCADRIDYSLRDACVFGEIENAEYFINNLVVENKKWIFKNFESAKKHAELFYRLNNKYWAGLVSNVMFKAVSDYLKYSLLKNYISKVDLYTTDKIVLAKISPFHEKDKHLQLLFDRMSNKIFFKDDPKDFEREVFCKSRVVDPLCKHNGEIERVSEIDASWGKILEEESKPKHYFIKFER